MIIRASQRLSTVDLAPEIIDIPQKDVCDLYEDDFFGVASRRNRDLLPGVIVAATFNHSNIIYFLNSYGSGTDYFSCSIIYPYEEITGILSYKKGSSSGIWYPLNHGTTIGSICPRIAKNYQDWRSITVPLMEENSWDLIASPFYNDEFPLNVDYTKLKTKYHITYDGAKYAYLDYSESLGLEEVCYMEKEFSGDGTNFPQIILLSKTEPTVDWFCCPNSATFVSPKTQKDYDECVRKLENTKVDAYIIRETRGQRKLPVRFLRSTMSLASMMKPFMNKFKQITKCFDKDYTTELSKKFPPL